MEDSTPGSQRPRRRPPATPEQMAARAQDAAARSATQERKNRTRQLIQVGGVMASWGLTTPDQAEELMAALASRESWTKWLAARGVDLSEKERRRGGS